MFEHFKNQDRKVGLEQAYRTSIRRSVENVEVSSKRQKTHPPDIHVILVLSGYCTSFGLTTNFSIKGRLISDSCHNISRT
ncbi:hypothetical protein VNO77_22920 [Canavalia gladiata]|uniref:Uncharacterized protein n=1 Tax=Canavalia gladiata TaxID=3824 RepID=A0AAN9L6T8_CANGL